MKTKRSRQITEPSGLTPTRARVHRVPLRLGLLVVLLAGGLAAWSEWTAGWPAASILAGQAAEISAYVVPEAAAAVNQGPPQINSPSSLPTTSHAMVEPPLAETGSKAATLEHIRLVQVGDQLRVALAFSHMPGYRLIRQADGRRIVLELPAETKILSLPISETPPLLSKLVQETPEGRIQLVFFFDQACRYDELRLANHSDGEGRTLTFAVRPECNQAKRPTTSEVSPAAAPSIPPADGSVATAVTADPAEALPEASEFVRRTIRPTPRRRAEMLLREGVAALRHGHPAEAEKAIRTALAIEPGHVGARDTLLHLMDRQKRRGQIKTLLAEGLREVPDHLPYRVRFARLLIEEGDLQRARQELTRQPLPPAAEAPDLYAMLATVDLRQGRYGDAATTYRALLAVSPKQAAWCMGLGIASEGGGDFEGARQAYAQALVYTGLSDRLRDYVHQRLAASEKQQVRPVSVGRISGEVRS